MISPLCVLVPPVPVEMVTLPLNNAVLIRLTPKDEVSLVVTNGEAPLILVWVTPVVMVRLLGSSNHVPPTPERAPISGAA